MSSRQIRRLQEQLQAASVKNDKDEDDDFEPLYVNNHNSSYDLLTPDNPEKTEDAEDNSGAEDKNDFSLLTCDSPDEEENELSGNDVRSPAANQKKKKNNRKKKNKRNKILEDTVETDEIERALAEVNFMLGEPEPTVSQTAATDDCVSNLLKVNHKYLSPEGEFTRRFGPDEEEQKKHQRPDMLRLCRRHIILPTDTLNLSINGLSMVQLSQQGDVKYFKYIHSSKYQIIVRGLIADVKFQLANMSSEYDIYPATTAEAILQNVDLYFMLEEISSACKLLEALILHLQNNFCPSFNYVDGKTRLEYKHVENRPFHIILLKYIYFSTNKACHRTALEISKVLLSLDPSDPLAVIFIMDTLALRAREHQWLVDLYMRWVKERDVGILFHVIYSHALARYHLYLKSKKQEDSSLADYYLRDAIIKYPNVALMLLAHCNVKNPTLTEHEVFTKQWNTTASKNLENLQELYVKLAGPKWREGNIMKWFVDVAQRLKADYDRDPAVQAACCAAANVRNSVFKRNPIEITRHLFVIRAMSNLLVDGAIPASLDTYAFNPYPLEGQIVDDPGYFSEPANERPSGWRFFLESLVPGTNDFNGQT